MLFCLRSIVIILVILIINIINPTLLAKDYEIKTNFDAHFIGDKFITYEDKNQSLTITDLIQLESSNWRSLGPGTINLSYTLSNHWFKVNLVNHTATRQKRIFQFTYTPLDEIDVYIVKNNDVIEHIATGDSRPVSDKVIAHRTYLVPVNINEKEKLSIYIKGKTEGSFQMPVYFWDMQSLFEQDQEVTIVLSAFFGLVMVMFFYNLTLFVILKDINYLWYVCHLFFVFLAQLGLKGYGFFWVWPDIPEFNQSSVVLSIFAQQLFTSLFAYSFLEIKPKDKFYFYAYKFSILTSLFGLLSYPFFDYSYSARLVAVNGLMIAVIIIASSFHTWARGSTSAKYFTIAYTTFALGVIVYSAKTFSLLPVNFLTVNSILIGTAIEVTLLSLAMAERIDEIKHQIISVRQESLENISKLNNDKLIFLSRIVKRIAHEMNTPIGNISIANGKSISLEEELEKTINDGKLTRQAFTLFSTQVHNSFNIVKSSIESIAELVKKFKQLSIHEYNKREQFKLHEVFAIFESKYAQAGNPLIYESEDNIVLYTYKEPLIIILEHLLENSRQHGYRFQSGSIALSVSCSQNNFTLTISDQGHGFPDSKLAQMKSMLNPNSSSNNFSLGLGLDIVYNFIHYKYNGNLDIKSTAGQTSVIVMLPDVVVPSSTLIQASAK